MSTSRARLGALALVTISLLACGSAVATADTAPASVTGSAHGVLPGDRFPSWGGDPVTLSLDAHAAPSPGDPSHATGTWQAVHTRPDSSLYAAFGGTITTLSAAGSLAMLNGVITWKDNPANPGLPMVGTPVALSVADRPDGDRVGFVWGFFGEPVAAGQAHVPFFALDESTLSVRTAVPGPRGGLPGSRAGLPGRRVSGTLDLGGSVLTVDASAAAGATAATGTITLTQPTGTLQATVTDLDASGPLAIATATVTAGSSAPIGSRISVSCYDGGTRDWAGWTAPGQPVLPAQGVLPQRPGLHGDLTVTD
ncbi:MAG TPA: hypothetical protein VGH57_30620 [Amycolatopsis sp.]|jgi:hypothetical protein